MKWFQNLKTSVKLISAFVVVAMLLAFTGYFGISKLGSMNASISNLYDNNLVPISVLSEAASLQQQIRVNIRDMNYFADSDRERDEYKAKIEELNARVDEMIATYRATKVTQAELDQLAKFDRPWTAYQALMADAMQHAYDGDTEGFEELSLSGGMKQTGDEMSAMLAELIKLNNDIAERTITDADNLFIDSRNVMVAVIVIAVILSVGLGYVISRMIAGPLGRVVRLVEKVAAGDLRETADIDTKDEVGRLAAAINGMIGSLRTTVGGILKSAEGVAASAQQISASTEEIASGSSSQANSAQMMSEMFQELSEAINAVARSAEQAAQLAGTTTGIAQDGGKVVESSIRGMSQVNEQVARLEEDSNRIGDIIEVIDEIAEQTNLLALNAAIEAARAGDQGRGFAVVADEVRKLAERSGEATKQISAIIKGMQQNTQQSVKAVSEGVELTQRTGEAFDHILRMVRESGGKVTEIAAASEQQAAQSADVMSSIETISAATEEAAASSEETAATAQSLAELAVELNAAVAVFKIR